MKKWLGTLLIALQLLYAGQPILTASAAPETSASELSFPLSGESYQASIGFSSVQGQNGWSYQEWNGTAYKDMTWDSVGKFWVGSSASASVNIDIQHPDGTDSVRKWTAPRAGYLHISGTVSKYKDACGNGVHISIKKNNGAILAKTIAYNELTGVNADVDVSVRQGDALYFTVNRNGPGATDNYCDMTRWDPLISYYDSHSFVNEFSSEQGRGGWFYEEWNGSAYVPLPWNSTNQVWQSSQYTLIARGEQHPAATDSALKWVAPATGQIKVTGNTAKTNISCGNGVIVEIRKNQDKLWSRTIAFNDSVGYDVDETIGVRQGDAIYFTVNRNGSKGEDNYCDGTRWEPTITYYRAAVASAGFSNVQGQNNWFYEEGGDGTYTRMTWATTQWSGASSAFIQPGYLHPAGKDAVRTWQAPRTGLIRVTGNVAKENLTCGNGVVVKLLRNDETLWTRTVAYNDAKGYDLKEAVSVKLGDAVRFVVNRNGSKPEDNSCDYTRWDPVITYQPSLASSYNAAGQLTSTRQNQGAHIEYEYDANGNLLRKFSNGNLLANGSFENFSGTSGLADNWLTWASAPYTQKVISSSNAVSGSKGQEMSVSGLGKDGMLVLYQPVTATPNQSVIATGQVFVHELKNAKVIYIVDFYDQNNTWLANLVSKEITAPTDVFVTLSASGKVPANAVKANPQVYIIGTSASEQGSGKITADLVNLRYETGDNLLVNGGFEHHTDLSRLADGWLVWRSHSYTDTVSVVGDRDSGVRAQRIATPALPPGGQYVLHQLVAVKPGDTIEGSIKAKIESIDHAIVFYDIDFLDKNRQYISNKVSGTLAAPTNGFTELAASGTVPPNAALATVSFFIRADSTGGKASVIVDSASLKVK